MSDRALKSSFEPPLITSSSSRNITRSPRIVPDCSDKFIHRTLVWNDVVTETEDLESAASRASLQETSKPIRCSARTGKFRQVFGSTRPEMIATKSPSVFASRLNDNPTLNQIELKATDMDQSKLDFIFDATIAAISKFRSKLEVSQILKKTLGLSMGGAWMVIVGEDFFTSFYGYEYVCSNFVMFFLGSTGFLIFKTA